MFGDGSLTFQEFMTQERVALATLQDAVLEFLCGRDDAVLFGAQAVNAYVKESRMTQDVDILSNRAAALAGELRDYLDHKFNIAVRVREVKRERGFRLYQVQKIGNRHLVDIRSVETLPATQRIEQVLVVTPEELIAGKVLAFHQRRGKPKSGSDWRDLATLLLTFPALKRESGPVATRLKKKAAPPEVLAVWKEIVAQEIRPEEEDEDFDY